MKRESGNALFLILIAVALFAALSYAITQSGRGGGGVDRETAEIAAAQIVQYAGQMEQAITRLKIIGGCNDTDISFHYDSDGDGTLETDGSDDYYNSGSTTDCYMFDPDGAALSYIEPNSAWLDSSKSAGTNYGQYFFTSSTCIDGLGSAGTNCHLGGTPETNPLIMFLPYLDKSVCDALARNSVAERIITNDVGVMANNVQFTGSFARTTVRFEVGGDSDNLTGCALSTSNGFMDIGGYTFYSVILVR